MIWQLLGLIVVMLLIAAIVAPFEALRWFAIESARDNTPFDHFLRPDSAHDESPDNNQVYIVYFSGIGAVSDRVNIRGEQPLLEEIADRLDGEQIVSHVFPYSPNNRGLLHGRWNSWWWRHLDWLSRRDGGISQFLIYIHNSLQFAVSADGRYGPMYSLGIAQTMWQELLKSGYRPGSKRPVIILGWSGGAQIGLGAAWYLASVGMPVYVISLAGVMSSDPGLDRIQHLWHIQGSKDWVPRIANVLFPGRWFANRGSHWGRAVAGGKITSTTIGPMRHLGKGSYLSSGKRMADGRTCRETTIEAIVDIITDAGLAHRR